MAVFVLDKRGKPLSPCSERRARVLLDRGRARARRVVRSIGAKQCTLIQRSDGYGYQNMSGASSPASKAGVWAPGIP